MKHPSENGNGRVPSSSRAPAKREPRVQTPTPDGVTAIADHEIGTQLRRLETSLSRDHPEMAAFLEKHAPELRSMMTTAIDGAVRSERRRLTWLLHNDVADLLAAARQRLSAVADATADQPVGEALRGIDVCLSAAAKATRGLISDLSPADPDAMKE